MTFVSTGINCGPAARAERARGRTAARAVCARKRRREIDIGGPHSSPSALRDEPDLFLRNLRRLAELRLGKLRGLRRFLAAVPGRDVEPIERLCGIVAALVPEARELLGGPFIAGFRR